MSDAPDFIPDHAMPQASAAPTAALTQTSPDFIPDGHPMEADEDKFQSTGQQLATVAEGVGQGIAGPIAPLAETKLGLTTPENIRGRASANPGEHLVGETVGFGAGLIAGTGEARAVGALGEVAAHALPALPKLAVTGVKTGAEMAALAASDELSKFVTEDPDQSLQTAATNIGLSAIMGGVGGAALGAVSPLFGKSAASATDLINDAKGQYDFRKLNPDVTQSAMTEISGRMQAADELRSEMGNLKGDALARAMPEMNEQNMGRINNQVQKIADSVTSRLEEAADSVKTKSAVPYLSEDFNKFLEKATAPDSNMIQKFNALNELKQDFAGYAKWGMTEEGSAKAAIGRELSNIIRPALEDGSVWGEAGSVQKQINKAITNSIRAQEDLTSKFTSKIMGSRDLDQTKVASLIKNLEKGKGGLKENVLKNYLDNTKGVADTIAKIHTDAGLDIPAAAQFNSTPALDHILGSKPSMGSQLGDMLAGIGGISTPNTDLAGMASIIGGHPVMGSALLAKRYLGSAIASMARPLLEKATDAFAARSGFEFINNVLKGQNAVKSAAGNVFKAGAMVLGDHMYPSEADRDKLDKKVSSAQTSPENMMAAGGKLGHYLPDHGAAAGSLAARASNYLNMLKPQEQQLSPLDAPIPPDKSKMAAYHRQLDIAQQPLLTLQHVKNGTLQPQDIQTLNIIYPKLHSQLISQLTDELTKAKSDGVVIPYKTKVSLGMFMGSPLDSTMKPQMMQNAVMANMGAQKTQSQGTPAASKPSMTQMQKVNNMYATPQQARAQSRTKQ